MSFLKTNEKSKNVSILLTCFGAILVLNWETINEYWKYGGIMVENHWNNIIDKYGENQLQFVVISLMGYTFVLYWSLGLLFTLMDIINLPKYFRKYKIQEGTNEPVDIKMLPKVILQVLMNQTIVILPLLYFGGQLGLKYLPPLRTVPSFISILIDFPFFIASYEIFYYYIHKSMHSGWLYKHIHKKHHEWKSPIAITAIYCHPIEHIFANLLPQIIGIVIRKPCPLTAVLWFTFIIVLTLSDHSGYHLPFVLSAENHDFHHLKFNTNYGVFGFLDYFHNTYEKFKATKCYDRHHIILGLSSAHQLHPDK